MRKSQVAAIVCLAIALLLLVVGSRSDAAGDFCFFGFMCEFMRWKNVVFGLLANDEPINRQRLNSERGKKLLFALPDTDSDVSINLGEFMGDSCGIPCQVDTLLLRQSVLQSAGYHQAHPKFLPVPCQFCR